MTGKELLTRLIDIGIYMLKNDLGEIDTTCGKFRIKVVVDLINEGEDGELNGDENIGEKE